MEGTEETVPAALRGGGRLVRPASSHECDSVVAWAMVGRSLPNVEQTGSPTEDVGRGDGSFPVQDGVVVCAKAGQVWLAGLGRSVSTC